jgi:tRNA(fMet)-specific endonuclease VapC
MKRYLLDTGIMGQFLDRRGKVPQRIVDARTRGDRIGTCIPVVAELHFGVELSSSRDENKRRLKQALSRIPSWPFDQVAAEEYGRIAADLRRSGRWMQVVDIMIAAIARTLGSCTVVSMDSGFSAIPDLSVENWAS